MDPDAKGQKEGDSRWMGPLQKENPLLSTKSMKFYDEVRSKIKNKKLSQSELSDNDMNGEGEYFDDDMNEMREMACSMTHYLMQVVKLVKMSGQSKKRFMEKYPHWIKCRHDNIRQLMEIAKQLEIHVTNCKASKITGSLVSLVGGGLSLAAGGNCRIAGSVMMGLGTLTSAGTSAIEEILFRENIDKARGIVELDKQHMEDLLEWLKGSRRLNKAYEKMKSFPYTETLLVAAERFQNILEKDLMPKENDREIEKVLKTLDFPPQLAEEIANIVGMLMAMSEIYQRYYDVFQVASRSHNVFERLRLSVDLFRGAYGGMVNALTTASEGDRLTGVQKGKIVCGMALDVVNILLTALQNPNSVEVQEIKKVVGYLKREADDFRKLYQRMNELEF